MPRLAIEGLKDPQVVHHFALEVQGLEEATFREASGFESSHDVIEHREVGKGGKQLIVKQPGNLKWADITLKKGLTDSIQLFEWRQKVIDGKMDEARKDGSIVMYNAMGEEVARFDFKRAWPSKWKGPDVNTTNNAVAIEELTLTHEGLVRSK
ncbi:MAG TPA: phage tail protein [Dehalococcoidia bacterium]|nr:phage tail protein [Dehalococcoidia bacterium]